MNHFIVERPSWRSNLYWAIIGAAVGNLLAGPMEAGKNAAYDRLFQSRALHEAATASQGDAGVCPNAKLPPPSPRRRQMPRRRSVKKR